MQALATRCCENAELMERGHYQRRPPDAALQAPEMQSITPRLAELALAMSDCILVSRDPIRAPINPHRLVALAWTMVGHAGGAPRRSRDLAAPASECRRRQAAALRSRLNGSWRSE